jgi:hypothetical protein
MQPWIPQALPEKAAEIAAALERSASYVVVEEVIADTVRTVVSVWPMLDADGRLRFGDPQNSIEYLDSRRDIEALLDDRLAIRITPEIRSVEVGDVYLVMGPVGRGPDGGGGPGGSGEGGRPRGRDREGEQSLSVAIGDLGAVDIYDVTADARVAAAATYSAATAGVLSHADVAIYLDDGEDDTRPSGGSAPINPTPSGGGGGTPGTASGAPSLAETLRAVGQDAEEPPAQATVGA